MRVQRWIPRLKAIERSWRRAASSGVAIAVVFAGIASTATFAGLPPEAQAQATLRIAAVVNDDIISMADLENRITLLLATSNLQNTESNRSRFRGIALRGLIEEQLKVQEAKRLEVRTDREEVDRALSQIAGQLRVPPEQLAEFLSQNGVSMRTLRDQVEAEIAWVKAVSNQMRGKVDVTDDEVAARIDRMSRDAGTPEYRIAEIFLPVTDPAQDAEVRKLADSLLQQIASGASFPALARNFSQGPTAAAGGDLGYVRPEQLPVDLREVVDRMNRGELSRPIRTVNGYYIIVVIDKRVAEGLQRGAIDMTLSRLVVALPPEPTPQDVQNRMDRARSLAAGAASCGELEALAGESDVEAADSLGRVDLDEIQEPLRSAVRTLAVGEKSAPVRTDEGIAVLMVCDRREDATDAEARERVRQMLANERLSAAARRMLRDLQREAFIDIRI